MSGEESRWRRGAKKVRRGLAGVGTGSFCVLLVVSVGEYEWPAVSASSWNAMVGWHPTIGIKRNGGNSTHAEKSGDEDLGTGDIAGLTTTQEVGREMRTRPLQSEITRADVVQREITRADLAQSEEIHGDSGGTGQESEQRVLAALRLSSMPDLPVAVSSAQLDRNDSLLDSTGAGEGSDEDALLMWSLSGDSPSTYPRATGVIGSEIEYNDYFSATDPENQRSNWLSNVHLEQTLAFNPNLKIESQARVVLNSDGEDTRFYSDFPHEGLYLVKLRAEYRRKNVAVFGGKYEPAAGLRGHGPVFFGNYTRYLNLDGRLGGGASVTIGNEDSGQHTLSGHLFRIDRSRLRGEIVSDRWRTDDFLADAGPLGWPKSYLLTLDGGTPETDDGSIKLRYTLGAGEQDWGQLFEERIALASLLGELPTSFGGLELSLDAMSVHGEGGYDVNTRIFGSSLGMSTASYFVGATYTIRRVYDRAEQVARLDQIGEIVGRYNLGSRTTIEAAYQHVLERGQHENALGLVIKYSADWMIY